LPDNFELSYKEILDGYRDEVAGMLRELVSFKSVAGEPAEGKPFGEEIHRAYVHTLSKAERDGFDVFDADGYGGHIEWLGALTDERGEITAAADGTLGVAVHLDVVPPGEGWTRDPWAGEFSDGRVYGRGTADNKGALVAVYCAMKALREAGFVPAKNVRLILGLDEESDWAGMDKYFEKANAPDLGFAPDAEFPVINGEKGILTFEIAKKLEPGHESGLYLRSMTGGSAPNMAPDFCRAILVYDDGVSGKGGKGGKARSKGRAKASDKETEARSSAFAAVREAAAEFHKRTGSRISCKGTGLSLEVAAHGLSAHGSTPEKGINAISILMDFLSALPLANESARDFVDFYRIHIGFEFDGKSLGIAMSDSISGALVVNTGMIELGREAVVLTTNVRYPVSRTEEDVYDALRPVLDENGLGVVKRHSQPPLYYAPDDPLVETLMDVYRENTGDEESRPIVIGGGTYARAIPGAVAFGPRFPYEEEVMHQRDEYICLDNLMKAAHIYADAIYRLTANKTSLPNP